MARRWLKGNTHTHTEYSDGDSPPELVVDWYEAHGYDWLFLTDHNILIPNDHLAKLQRGSIPVWQGEEVTMAAVHVNGLGVTELVTPSWPGSSRSEAEVSDSGHERIRWAVEQILAQGAVAQVNHPNYQNALTLDDLMAAGAFSLMEVANMHPGARNRGDATRPSTEALWDALLTAGRRIWAVASDDAHYFQTWANAYSNPGRGWLQVEAESARMGDVLDALRDGRFYASTGLELSAYDVSSTEVSLRLAGDTATIELVGPGGAVLETASGDRAQFKLSAVGSYARVRAKSSDWRELWTQPIFR